MSSPIARPMHPLLAAYLGALIAHPLRTKCITTATLQFFQEILASHASGAPVAPPSRHASVVARALAAAKIDSKAIKMALYGFFISAPLSHVLVGALQDAFKGKTSTLAKIGQILVSNLTVGPIQAAVYLTCMAVINGANSVDEVAKTLKAGYFSIVRTQWIVSPFSLYVAQRYLPLELWVPWFNLIQFIAGTYINTKMKLLRQKQLDKDRKDKETKEE